MQTEGKTIWQIAAGDTNRNYAQILLKWDIAAVGPGYAGAWPGCRIRLEEDKWTSKKISDLMRFCQDVKEGDIIVLRLGTSQVWGVGIVSGPYEWLDDFGDIDGWNLQHIRRVKWIWKAEKNEPKEFDPHTLKWGSTTQVLNSEAVIKWLEDLKPNRESDIALAKLPCSRKHNEPVHLSSFSAIAQNLFDHGLPGGSVDKLVSEMEELVRIASWYERAEVEPSEHETVAYLVIPLLNALGWPPQRMAVEWNLVDVALFSQMPRDDENLSIVVEAKKRNSSCLTARSQAESYANSDGRESCGRLIVTDGVRFGVYLRNRKNEFSNIPYAYLNLTRLMDEYPILECRGATAALTAMSPSWKS